jgi:hypothetical protein
MNSDHDWYVQTARLHIRFLRQDSPNAAALLDRLFETDGARAALQASSLLLQLQTHLKRTGAAGKLDRYESGMHEFPTAIPLFRRALRWFTIDYSLGLYQKESDADEFTLSVNKTDDSEPRRPGQ